LSLTNALFISPTSVASRREAAAIANQVLAGVLSQLAPGKVVHELCSFGDALIEQLTGSVYKSKKMEKGVAFPTCVSLNECVGHNSPLKSDTRVLADGDVVKVDLGVHLDGHIALVAHTVVLGAGPERPVRGAAGDVIAAAHCAAEVALRLIKPGAKNSAVTAELERVAAAFGVQAIVGVQSFQLQQFVLEGATKIALKADVENKVEERAFAANEAYAVDICFSTGDGKPRELETRTTVFKRTVDVSYHLKMKASQRLIAEVAKKHPTLPFTLRAFDDEKEAKLGVTECLKHGVLGAYPVLFEREGAVVAQFRFTVLLLPGGSQKVTGLDLPAFVGTDKKLPDDLAAVRASVPYVVKAKKEKAAAPASSAMVE